MVLLDNNAFLLAFEKLVEKQKGTVFISMKRFTPSSSSSSSSKKKSKGHSHDDNVQCLIRVTDGKKVKISTTVSDLKNSQLRFLHIFLRFFFVHVTTHVSDDCVRGNG
eukprot:TRINITY_DN2755_c0_g1_i2.p1 TRINITY_DN2755_c0_g1~~TRINITY_DN2755_c0_g1_i2.p1  ORF type:complete len:125 (-),score=28.71 TRINITY_DN2755_c0_g1_i2:15-338(-)